MKFTITIFAVALVAAAYGVPVDLGINTGLVQGNLHQWNNDFVLGGQKIQFGVGWNKATGQLAAGGKFVAVVNGQELPLSAAISTNINDPSRVGEHVQYEIGTRVLDKISAVLYGSGDGALKYLLSAASPVSSAGKGTAVGVSLEGENLNPRVLSAGVSHGQENIKARIGFGDDYKPDTVNVQLGGNPNEI